MKKFVLIAIAMASSVSAFAGNDLRNLERAQCRTTVRLTHSTHARAVCDLIVQRQANNSYNIILQGQLSGGSAGVTSGGSIFLQNVNNCKIFNRGRGVVCDSGVTINKPDVDVYSPIAYSVILAGITTANSKFSMAERELLAACYDSTADDSELESHAQTILSGYGVLSTYVMKAPANGCRIQ